MSQQRNGLLLVSPHRFPDLQGERALADEFALSLYVAQSQADLTAHMPEARAVLMTPFAHIGPEEVALAAQCAAIVRYGVGLDNIDVEAATAAGIPVANVPDAAVEEVAAHALACALALVRHIREAEAALRSGGWDSSAMIGVRRMSTLTVGVVGLGRIGRRVAEHFSALGCSVLVCDPVAVTEPWEATSLDDLVARSDIITLHIPSASGTANLFSRERITDMRPGAILINMARGGLVDEHALAAALVDGALGGAAVDVFAEEPLPLDHPLRTAPRTILTGHVAWRSDDAQRDYQAEAIAAARAALAGDPIPNIVTGVHS